MTVRTGGPKVHGGIKPNMTVRTGGPKVHGGITDLAGETMIDGKTMDGGLPLPRRV